MARAFATLSPRVEKFARLSATPVKLEELYRLGRGDVPTRLQMAQFLHQEIAIRNAQLCKELRLLPFGLAETQGTSDVISWFSSYVDWLADLPAPKTAEDDKEFTDCLRRILEDNSQVVRTLGRGVLEVRARVGEERYEEIRSEVDFILDRFFIKRIGLRFLIQHHIESARELPGTSGIIHSNVEVGPILREAAAKAQAVCRAKCHISPEVLVVGDGIEGSGHGHGLNSTLASSPNLSHNRHFTYVPAHLHFMCYELLKNACEAVARHHTGNGPAAVKTAAQSRQRGGRLQLPIVRAVFAHGNDEVGIKISDAGGGIPRSELQMAWSYFDVPTSSMMEPGDGAQKRPGGAGLPLARLHARYYGGDLTLKSMEGFGTDAFLFLNRLGQNCESLPHGVRVSPAQRDSSLGDDASILLESLGIMSEPEATFLKHQLREYRVRRKARVGDGLISAAAASAAPSE